MNTNILNIKWVSVKWSLRKKCPYSELFWSAFFTRFPAFGLNTERYCRIFPAFGLKYGEIRSISPYSVWMRENARKIRTRITPNTDTFAQSMVICIKQHLSNIWSYIHEKLKQHWGWVRKKRVTPQFATGQDLLKNKNIEKR